MKTKKIICFILSLLLIVPCLCLSSCNSKSGDDVGGLSTEDTQNAEENTTPNYTAPAKYKELANDDTVYHSGMYTGYSIIIKDYMKAENGQVKGSNLFEVMLDHPGEADPVHEDPTCSHDSFRCPTSSETMSKEVLIAKRENGLPIIFYFGIYLDEVYTEDGETTRSVKVCEVRGYDVETGEYTTVAGIPIGKIENAVLYKGKMYLIGFYGNNFGMVDIVTGESKVIEPVESYEGLDIYYNEYNILGIENDRLYYMHVFGEMGTDVHKIVKNFCLLKSCSLDLGDVKTEYDFGDLGTDYHRGGNILSQYTYMDGSEIYLPKNNRFTVDPQFNIPEAQTFYYLEDFEVFDIYALDLNNTSEGEKLILKDVYKYAVKDGKLYYTLVDYKEVGKISSSESPHIKMFASTDGGNLYEYDTDTGETREVYSDSGYNIIEIYEITNEGKLFFDGRDYVGFVPAEEGNYTSRYNVGRKEYCMLDISTGEVTELYAPLKLGPYPEDVVIYS